MFSPVLLRGCATQRLMHPKSWSSRQTSWPDEGRCSFRIFPLEEGHDRFNEIHVLTFGRQHASRFGWKRSLLSFDLVKDRSDTLSAEEPQDHFDAQVCLLTGHPSRLQEPRQIGRRRVGGVQLRQRGNQQ